MPFDMYDDVILTRDVDERGLRAHDVGTGVERHLDWLEHQQVSREERFASSAPGDSP